MSGIGAVFFFSSRRRHTRWNCDWSSDVCSSDLKETWDGRAKDDQLQGTYVTMADRNQRMLEIDEALRYIPPGKVILDVGCGNGYSTAIFAKQAELVLAIDYSEAMIARAKREYGAIPNITF